jgi:hypothetical protein
MNRLLLLFSFLLFLSGCDDLQKIINSKIGYDVTYSVTGTAAAVNLTIENEDSGTSQFSDEPLPWEYSFTGESGAFVYVSAQNQTDTGSVTATIYCDGDKLKTSTSTGAYVITTASGSLPD